MTVGDDVVVIAVDGLLWWATWTGDGETAPPTGGPCGWPADIHAPTLGPDGTLLFLASTERGPQVWALAPGADAPVCRTGEPGGVTAFAYAGGTLVAAAHGELVVSGPHGHTRVTTDAPWDRVALSPDGAELLLLGPAGPEALTLLSLASGATRRVRGPALTSPRWFPQGRHFVALRHVAGQPPECVIVDSEDGSVATLPEGAPAQHAIIAPAGDGAGVFIVADGVVSHFDFGSEALRTLPASAPVRALEPIPGTAEVVALLDPAPPVRLERLGAAGPRALLAIPWAPRGDTRR